MPKVSSRRSEPRTDLKVQREKLEAQRAQLKNEISTKTGEARSKLQADLDRISAQIADSEAALDEYYARRDDTGLI
jgi:septal ring factor EnvC (AmiA/AmiB activator)